MRQSIFILFYFSSPSNNATTHCVPWFYLHLQTAFFCYLKHPISELKLFLATMVDERLCFKLRDFVPSWVFHVPERLFSTLSLRWIRKRIIVKATESWVLR